MANTVLLKKVVFPLRKSFTKFSIAHKYLYPSLSYFEKQFRTIVKFSLKLQLLGMEIYWNNFRISLPAQINSLNKAENCMTIGSKNAVRTDASNAHHFPRKWQTLHEIFRCEWQWPEPPRATVKWHLLHSEWNNLQWNNLMRIFPHSLWIQSSTVSPSELYYVYKMKHIPKKHIPQTQHSRQNKKRLRWFYKTEILQSRPFLVSTRAPGLQDVFLRNMFYCIFY